MSTRELALKFWPLVGGSFQYSEHKQRHHIDIMRVDPTSDWRRIDAHDVNMMSFWCQRLYSGALSKMIAQRCLMNYNWLLESKKVSIRSYFAGYKNCFLTMAEGGSSNIKVFNVNKGAHVEILTFGRRFVPIFWAQTTTSYWHHARRSDVRLTSDRCTWCQYDVVLMSTFVLRSIVKNDSPALSHEL